MANKRMFSSQIVESDAFYDLSVGAQALYLHLSMNADDDGFINSAKKIQRSCGASQDDLNELIEKKFLLVFNSGVMVIKHWKMNNNIQKDRYKHTVYQEEMEELHIKDNKSYTFSPAYPKCIQSVSKMDTQSSLVKSSLDKNRLDKNRLDKSSQEDSISIEHSILDELTEKEKQDLISKYGSTNVGIVAFNVDRKGYTPKDPYRYLLTCCEEEIGK